MKRARLPLALVLVIVLAACGSTGERTAGPASSGQESVPAETFGQTTAVDESKLQPPQILLRYRSKVDDQRAVPGSFCVDYVDPASGSGSGVCGDSPAVHPKAVTVLQPGEEVAFIFEGARIVRLEGCQAEDEQSCIGYVSVKPLGCEDGEVKQVPLALGPKTRWTVDLAPGAYELDVFGYFRSGHGARGDVSGALGLVVGGGPKRYDALGVTRIKREMQVCPPGGAEVVNAESVVAEQLHANVVTWAPNDVQPEEPVAVTLELYTFSSPESPEPEKLVAGVNHVEVVIHGEGQTRRFVTDDLGNGLYQTEIIFPKVGDWDLRVRYGAGSYGPGGEVLLGKGAICVGGDICPH